MAVLCISNDFQGKEKVKICEGEIWSIDQYTMQFEDSNHLLKENSGFDQIFPSKCDSDIKIFDENREVFVLYRKHYIVFLKIMKDFDFLNYYFQNNKFSPFFSDPSELEYYLLQLSCSVDQFHKELFKGDKQSQNAEEKSQYFIFLRGILDCYMHYSKEYKEVKTVQEIYEESCWNWAQEEEEELQEEEDNQLFSESYSAEDDIEEPRYNILEEFLGNPNFERYYRNTFHDDFLFIFGNSTLEYPCQEIYQRWYEYAEKSFSGTIVCPTLKDCSRWETEQFDKAAIVYFLVFKKDPKLEKLISFALLNKAEVVILMYESSLYEKYSKKYSKKYPQSVILLLTDWEEDKVIDEMDQFMISCYNRAKGKWYRK